VKENNILVAKKEPTKKYTFEIIKVKNSHLDIKIYEVLFFWVNNTKYHILVTLINQHENNINQTKKWER